MSADLAIIIPTLNEAQQFGNCLRAVGRARAAVPDLACAIQIVDGGSTDETRAVAERSGMPVMTLSEGRRSAQMNAGARSAEAPWLLFLHADTWLGKDSLATLWSILRENPDILGGAFERRFYPDNPFLRMTSRWAAWRVRRTGWSFGDQAQFFRRSAYEAAGGYPATDPFEAWDLSRRVARQGRLICVAAPVTTSSRRFSGDGALLRTVKDLGLVVRHHWRNRE
ncbi:MAG: TIGR04283 family arsenosugar biosynthesis glycosyltransferase [Opitutales bacterium]